MSDFPRLNYHVSGIDIDIEVNTSTVSSHIRLLSSPCLAVVVDNRLASTPIIKQSKSLQNSPRERWTLVSISCAVWGERTETRLPRCKHISSCFKHRSLALLLRRCCACIIADIQISVFCAVDVIDSLEVNKLRPLSSRHVSAQWLQTWKSHAVVVKWKLKWRVIRFPAALRPRVLPLGKTNLSLVIDAGTNWSRNSRTKVHDVYSLLHRSATWP